MKQKKCGIFAALPISDRKTVAVGVGAGQNLDKVNDRADAADAAGKQIKNSHADFARVETVSADNSEKEAQQKRNQFAFGTGKGRGVDHDVLGIVVIHSQSSPDRI